MTTMKTLFPIAFVITLTGAGPAMADDDCRQPMAQWQSREAVAAHISELGITTDRLRIDDGCYKIRGRDGEGNRIELKIDPATLELLELEVRFRAGADPSRYLSAARGQAGSKGTSTDSPSGKAPGQPLAAPQSSTN
ncbi:MAG: PepSY domain-containing protein [Burkholderiaceae bacterium]